MHFIRAASENFDILLERAARYLIDRARVALKRQSIAFLLLLFPLVLARRLDVLLIDNVHILLLPAHFRLLTLIYFLAIFMLQTFFWLLTVF